jgi:hypothetical protein
MDEQNLLGEIEEKKSNDIFSSVRSESTRILYCCEKIILTLILIIDFALGVLFNVLTHISMIDDSNNKKLGHWTKYVASNYIWLYSILLTLYILYLCKKKFKPIYYRNTQYVLLFFLHLIALGRFILIIVITVIMSLVEKKHLEFLRIVVIVWLIFNYLSFFILCKYFTIDFLKNLIRCCRKDKKQRVENGRTRNKKEKKEENENKETSVIYT